LDDTRPAFLLWVVKYVFHSNDFEGVAVNEGATRQIIEDALRNDVGLDEAHVAEERQALAADDDLHRRNLAFVLPHFLCLQHVWKWQLADFTEASICRLHALLMQGIEPDADATVQPGQYRVLPCSAHGVGGRDVNYLAPGDIPQAMARLLSSTRRQMMSSEHTLDNGVYIAATFMVNFLKIHPFGDGNGRLGRLLANGILSLCGLPFPLVLVKGRLRKTRRLYLQLLDRIQHRNADASMAATYFLHCILDQLRTMQDEGFWRP
jgi:Fic family protein